ncbi:hypothetical protein ACKFKF_23420 [Phormidesmis sp. 146-12]
MSRPEGMRSGTLPRLSAADVQDKWEEAMLLAWWREAAKLSQINCSEADPSGEDQTVQGFSVD